MQAKGITHRGLRENNEDSFLALLDRNLFAVADGMGGHNAGEVASNLAIETLEDYFLNVPGNADPEQAMKAAIDKANRKIYFRSQSENEFKGMGTTLTMVWIKKQTAWVAHVGDSRAYLLRGGSMRLLTSDHSFAQALVNEGSISGVEAEKHPHRNILTRAVGIQEHVSVDFRKFAIQEHDLILLCTDGLTSVLSVDDIVSIIGDSETFDKACTSLVEAACREGGADNITSVLIGID